MLGLQFPTRLLAGLLLTAAVTMAQDLADRRVEPGAREPVPRLTEDAAPAQPAELKAESAIYLQRRLGSWLEADARKTLGEPRRRRDALEEGAVTGAIFAFRDPTGRYREFELLFDRHTKTLRSVFIYPWRMTWDDCRELWGEDVNATPLANGNIFRSYLTRRLDVLADKTGSVINLGIY